jgi:energy-converting hydrogenase B subunit E
MGNGMSVSNLILATGFATMLIGLWGMLTHRNIIRIIVGFSVIDTGVRIVMVSTGYIIGGTAPIIDRGLSIAEAPLRAVDPVPSALLVTAIVIGFAVTAIMLAFAILLHRARKTLAIDAFMDSKW